MFRWLKKRTFIKQMKAVSSMLQLVQNRILSLLDVIEQSESQQFRAVVSSVLWLANQPPASNIAAPVWSKDVPAQKALHRLTTKWQSDNSELPAHADYADVVFLLSRAKLDFRITGAMTADLSSPIFAEEVRYAGIVVAAAKRDRAILYSLLDNNLSGTNLLLAVLRAAMYAHNVDGKLTAALPLADDRSAVDFVMVNVHSALEHFPMKKMLPSPESPRSLHGVRYGTIAALASVAIRHINRM